MVTSGPASWLTVVVVGLWEAYRFALQGREGARVEPDINVYVPSPQPSESTCHCECIGFTPSVQPWEFWPPVSFAESSSGSWVWVILSTCLLISLLIIRLCLSLLCQCHRSDFSHASIQTYHPFLANGFSQTFIRTTSVGVQTDSTDASVVLGSPVSAPSSAGSRGITTPSRKKQWQAPLSQHHEC